MPRRATPSSTSTILIAKAASLLRSSQSVEWVLFKLDGGLDHILVDEAQDTSPVQWKVITALADEFFSGFGAREEPRTLFAVGDEKQSIYSFQGAEPKMFAAQGDALGERAEQAGASWRRVPLTLSFRSVEPLLAAVDAVFADPERTPGLGAAAVRHVADRAGHAGLVEIWPTEKHEAPDAGRAVVAARGGLRCHAVGGAPCQAHRRYHCRLAPIGRDARLGEPPGAGRRHPGSGAQARAVRAGARQGAEGARRAGGRRGPPDARPIRSPCRT